MPLQATSGVATYDAFGGGVPVAANYIEDVFSTWLYTGNSSTQTITNGIDLAGKGGMVWSKARSTSLSNFLCDTVRGRAFYLYSNNTFNQAGPSSAGNDITAFNNNGYSLGPNQNADINNGSATFASWTFAKQEKFFDVVTWTGNLTARTIAHNLGSVPGCIILKATSSSGDWWVYHRSLGATQRISLNGTSGAGTNSNPWNNTEPTATEFSLSSGVAGNDSGVTYVAYLFAHNAGGFGLTGTDNVISCGSYTGNGSTQDINLGYEAQWVLVKNATTAGWDWYTVDNMRGFVVTPASPNFTKSLSPNTSGAESDLTAISPSSTGFRLNSSAGAFNTNGDTYIYIAIRRGPMKTPTTGTSVFKLSRTANTFTYPIIQNQNSPLDSVDLLLTKKTNEVKQNWWANRLTGFNQFIGGEPGGSDGNLKATPALDSTSSSAETSTSVISLFLFGTTNGAIYASVTDPYSVLYGFKRAPGFFDVCCYTGNGTTQAVSHNLAAIPELMLVKRRNVSGDDFVARPSVIGQNKYMYLTTMATLDADTGFWNDTAATSSAFTVGNRSQVNASGSTYVAYLFASVPGVSKVGSYTGTGTTQTINCGFTAGSRFVLIKRTDSTGDWYVWDSARGIVAGNDPYLLLNSTAAEVTSTDYVDTAATGFELSSTAPAAINASGGTYIFLAIA